MAKEHYDEGWIARCNNESFDPRANLDWRDGWKDCDEVSPEERVSGRATLENMPRLEA